MIFQEIPVDFQKEADIVGCYVEYAGKFILLYRQPYKSYGGTFGLPAGKVEQGEALQDAMAREIREETGICLKRESLEFIGSVFVRNKGHDIGYHMFVTRLSEKPVIIINPQEHQSFTWVSPTESLHLNLIHDLGECIRQYYRVALPEVRNSQ